jgi:hypothetical protein
MFEMGNQSSIPAQADEVDEQVHEDEEASALVQEVEQGQKEISKLLRRVKIRGKTHQAVKALVGVRKKSYTIPIAPKILEAHKRMHEAHERFPYGRCTICDSDTHITKDHSTVKKKFSTTRKPEFRFVCNEQSAVFQQRLFDDSWTVIQGQINEAARVNPGLFHEKKRGSWKSQWNSGKCCCPSEIKTIASDMVRLFTENGVTTKFAHTKLDPIFLYLSICYAVVRVFLDQLEWESVHNLDSFRMYFHMPHNEALEVIRDGQAIVIAMVTNQPICNARVTLGIFLTRLVNWVRDEVDPYAYVPPPPPLESRDSDSSGGAGRRTRIGPKVFKRKRINITRRRGRGCGRRSRRA